VYLPNASVPRPAAGGPTCPLRCGHADFVQRAPAAPARVGGAAGPARRPSGRARGRPGQSLPAMAPSPTGQTPGGPPGRAAGAPGAAAPRARLPGTRSGLCGSSARLVREGTPLSASGPRRSIGRRWGSPSAWTCAHGRPAAASISGSSTGAETQSGKRARRSVPPWPCTGRWGLMRVSQ